MALENDSILDGGLSVSISFPNTGMPGPKGDNVKGDRGDKGYSAYELWLQAGNQGDLAAYLASLKGPKGDGGSVDASNLLPNANMQRDVGSFSFRYRTAYVGAIQAAGPAFSELGKTVFSNRSPAVKNHVYSYQANYDPAELGALQQLDYYETDVDKIRSIREDFAFGALTGGFGFTKPLAECWTRSRGDGISPTIGDGGQPATRWKRTRKGDQVYRGSWYGSSDYNASHIAYLQVSADGDNPVQSNECPGWVSMTTSNAYTQGAGWIINSLSQMIVPGPNHFGPPPGTNFGAHFSIGPGSAAPGRAPFKMYPTVPARTQTRYQPDGTPYEFAFSAAKDSVLLDVPEPGAIEVDVAGKFYLTDAAGRRGQISTERKIIAQSGVRETLTGTAGSLVVKKEFTLPAHSLGPNGYLRVSFLMSATANTNAKDAGFAFLNPSTGAIMASILRGRLSDATMSGWELQGRFMNKGVENANVTQNIRLNGSNIGNISNAAIDTAVEQKITLYLSLDNAADTVSIESYFIEAVYGA